MPYSIQENLLKCKHIQASKRWHCTWDLYKCLLKGIGKNKVGVSGGGRSRDSGWEIARISQVNGFLSYNLGEAPPSPSNNTGVSFHIVLYEGQCPYLWFFFPAQCVRLETPLVVKLPWLSLKPRPNEIWMCREWIRVMEWAKYCLCCVSAILSWGDRISGLRKVKTPLQVQHIHQQASEVCLHAMLMITEYFGVWGKNGFLWKYL